MKKILQVIVKCLVYTGFWPQEGPRRPKKTAFDLWHLVFPWLQVSRMVYGIFAQAYNIYLDWGRINYMIEYFVILVIEVKALIFLYILIARNGEIEDVVIRIRKIQDVRNGDQGMKKILEITNLLARYLTIAALVVANFISICVALTLVWYGLNHRQIPFRKWFPYDASQTPIFEVTLCTVMTMQISDLFVIFIFDILFFIVIIHIIGQYVLLGYKLENMHDLVTREISAKKQFDLLDFKSNKTTLQIHNRNTKATTFGPFVQPRRQINLTLKLKQERKYQKVQAGVKRKVGKVGTEIRAADAPDRSTTMFLDERDLETARCLRHCVQHHRKLIKLGQSVVELKQLPFAYQLFCTSLTSLLAVYVAKMSVGLDAKSCVMCAIAFGSVLEFFAFCILGSILQKYSSDLSYAVFSSNWLGLSMKVKQSLLILMAHSWKGVVLRALAVFPINLEIFLQVYKFSYSLYAVLVKVSSGHKIF